MRSLPFRFVSLRSAPLAAPLVQFGGTPKENEMNAFLVSTEEEARREDMLLILGSKRAVQKESFNVLRKVACRHRFFSDLVAVMIFFSLIWFSFADK